MKARISILIFLLVNQFYVQCQETFIKTIDVHWGDLGKCIRQTNDGGYIIAGFTDANTSYFSNIALVQTDEFGDTIWTKSYGGEYKDIANCVQQTHDSGFVVAGTTHSFGTNWDDAFIIKTNSIGDTLWMKIVGGIASDDGYYVIQTHDSGFILFGNHYSNSFMNKYNDNGNELWAKSFEDFDTFRKGLELDDNRLIVLGGSANPPCPWCTTIDLVKTDMSGNIIWYKKIGSGEGRIYMGECVIPTSDKGFIIVGSLTEDFEHSRVLIIKTDSTGNLLWSKTYGNPMGGIARSIVQINDSAYIVTGTWKWTESMSTAELFLMKITYNGTMEWYKGYSNDTTMTNGYCIQKTIDENVIVVGNSGVIYPNNSPDIVILKADYNGVITNIQKLTHRRISSGVKSYPNPFTTSTTFEYELTEPSRVQLTIYNAIGEVVYRTEDRMMPQGSHTVTWSPSHLPEGLYYAVLRSEEEVDVIKMIKQ